MNDHLTDTNVGNIEYISKQDVLNLPQNIERNLRGEIVERSIDVKAIESLPSADVAPVKHGRWLPIVSYNHTYKCSECGRLLVDITDGLKMVAKHYPYCHCGARMDKE